MKFTITTYVCVLVCAGVLVMGTKLDMEQIESLTEAPQFIVAQNDISQTPQVPSGFPQSTIFAHLGQPLPISQFIQALFQGQSLSLAVEVASVQFRQNRRAFRYAVANLREQDEVDVRGGTPLLGGILSIDATDGQSYLLEQSGEVVRSLRPAMPSIHTRVTPSPPTFPIEPPFPETSE